MEYTNYDDEDLLMLQALEQQRPISSNRPATTTTMTMNTSGFQLPVSATYQGLQQRQMEAIDSNRPFYGYHRSLQEIEDEKMRQMSHILQQKIPQNRIDKRKGPGNMQLSYISGSTIITLLNETFGYDGWMSEVRSVQVEQPVNLPTLGNKRVAYSVSARVVVRITLTKNGVFREGIGVDNKTDSNAANAQENAIKGAETDAIKRAARQFGEYLGLSLYHK